MKHINIALSETEWEAEEGQTIQLTATVTPENATDKSIIWSSSDPEVATVSEEGLVTALREGKATITATAADESKVKADCEVNVTAAAPEIILVENIALSETEWEAEEGQTIQLTATVTPENATDKNVIWSSSDPQVATVSEEGLVTAVNSGYAIITATADDGSGVTAICEVTVTSKTVRIGSVEIGSEEKVDVYTMNGILLKKNADRDFISTLTKGIYIINISGKSYKVVK